MDITPADWPEAGGFWDRANDLTCGLILLPSGSILKFFLWLIFFPIPICISLYKREYWVALLYAVCTELPQHITFLYGGINTLDHAAYLFILMFVLPLLIKTWGTLVMSVWQRRLIRANLAVIWLLFCTADIMLGLGFHSSYCKLSLIAPLTR